jgi:hypothetical protein
MKPQFLLLLSIICSITIIPSCKEEVVEYQTNDCKKQPAFIKNVGFDVTKSALSTSEKRMKGLVLIEYNNNPSNGGYRLYQGFYLDDGRLPRPNRR